MVGIQYYSGLTAAGEEVNLRREPSNRYDSNAIQVKTLTNVQIGHIPAVVAAKLAPLMDRGLVKVTGEMVDGNVSSLPPCLLVRPLTSSLQLFGRPFKLNIDVGIFAPESMRQQLLPHLRWATPAPARRSAKLVPLAPQPNQTGVTGTSSPSKGKGKETAPRTVIQAEAGETPAQTAARQRRMEVALSALQRADNKSGDEVSWSSRDLGELKLNLGDDLRAGAGCSRRRHRRS